MSRRGIRPWFRESKGAWYVWANGKQNSLGVKGLDNEAEAVKAWHRLMAEVAEKAKPKPEASVAEVLTGFLADAEARVKLTTVDGYTRFLMPFSEKHGKKKVSELSAFVAEAYARKPTWSAEHKARFSRCSHHGVSLGRTGTHHRQDAVGGAETPCQGFPRGGSHHQAGRA